MPDQIKREKREFVRTPLKIDARVKPIGKEELDRKHHLKSALSHESSPKTPSTESDRSEAHDSTLAYLMEYMFQINEKLDKVIGLLGDGSSDLNPIHVKETLNISGSGVSLVVSSPVAVGILLDITLFIPDFPFGMFNVQGEVIRAEPKRGDETGYHEIGIKFLNLSGEERERLIAYTFRQQRRTIRDIKEYN